MASEEPFSWAGLAKIGEDPSGSIAQLLRHPQGSVVSEALRRAFELAYGDPSRYSKRREFLRRLHDERSALEALHELLALALLRVERWRLIEAEPAMGGPTHPDFFMLTLDGRQVLVEVKTVHRGDAFRLADQKRGELSAILMRNLALRGFACCFLEVLCTPSQLGAAPPVAEILERLLQQARRVTFKSRAYYAVELPSGGCIAFRLENSGFSGPLKAEFEDLEDLRARTGSSVRSLLRSFREKREQEVNHARRASARVSDGAAQIARSGAALPGIVVLCLGDANWSVRESIAATRAELTHRRHAGKWLPVSVIFASFFHPEIERQKAQAPLWASNDVASAERRIPVGCVQASWVDLADAAPLVKVIKPVTDVDLPMGILLPELVPFPSSRDEMAAAASPWRDGGKGHPTD